MITHTACTRTQGEFIGSALKIGSDLFSITDKKNTFGNGLDVDLISVEFGKWCTGKQYDTILAIGSSMGGFNALVFGPRLGAVSVMAITPRFSVHPEVFPTLKWPNLARLRDEITIPVSEWKYKTAEDEMAGKQVHTYLFHGGDEAEAQHADMFSPGKQRCHLCIAGASHDAMPVILKQKGMFVPLLRACRDMASADTVDKVFQDAGLPYWRQSPCVSDAERLTHHLKSMSMVHCKQHQQLRQLQAEIEKLQRHNGWFQFSGPNPSQVASEESSIVGSRLI